jgi:mannose-6-phosphate isomerase
MMAAHFRRVVESMADLQAVRIDGRVQAYQWGGREFLPSLLGVTNKDALPQAEYWLGAHPSACASTLSEQIPVDQFLAERGAPPLQFLLKILDVHDMLSIQAHPNKAQAQEGFARENALGIPLDAKNRNYKDTSDKPELMVALSEFWLLHGFRPPVEIATLLATHDCLAPLRNAVMHRSLETAFAFALDFSSIEVQAMQHALATELRTRQVVFAKDAPQFWIRRWLQQNPQMENGILTLFFLNLLKLEPGKAIYQPAGLLHAYLEGQNVELMANSDNVLRAGLTPKHIDVAELLRTCTIAPSDPQDFVISPRTLPTGETRFVTPFTEFELAELSASSAERITWQVDAPEILFCYQGAATVRADSGDPLEIKQGDSLLLLPGNNMELRPGTGGTRCFKARNLP